MNERQQNLVIRMRTLLANCYKAGLVVVADASGSGAIRLIPREEYGDGSDIRALGVTVNVDDACGGGAIPQCDEFGSR